MKTLRNIDFGNFGTSIQSGFRGVGLKDDSMMRTALNMRNTSVRNSLIRKSGNFDKEEYLRKLPGRSR